MTAGRRDEIIELLDCDIGSRPTAAPGVEQLLPHVRGVARTAGALVVAFDRRSAPTLEAFVEVERVCCAGIGWELEGERVLRLRITATDAQLDAIESVWRA